MRTRGTREKPAIQQAEQTIQKASQAAAVPPPVINNVVQAPKMPNFQMPSIPKAPRAPEPADPATQYIDETEQEGGVTKRRRRTGMARTVRAGETGGYKKSDTLG